MTFSTGGRVAAALLALGAGPALACSSCGCTLTSDWIDQGLVGQPGFRVDLRYDYVPQTVLRTGSTDIDRGAIALPTDREVEISTYNNYATLGLDYAPNTDWGFNAQIPLLRRPHTTIAEGEVGSSSSMTQGLGDVRLSARWQGFGGTGITGVIAGLKLPTGATGDTFDSGSEAGAPLDRGLQAGSGTTDALFGFYHFGNLSGRWDWFAQASGQVALTSTRDYRPGNAATVSAGLHFTGWQGITPQIQFNLRTAAKDSGAEADRDNSGGTSLYFAPGAAVKLGSRAIGYLFMQLPLAQQVNGWQLVPNYTLSAGIQFRL
ncbi:hypothetical protein EUV02_03730 [Polymorphobacter arshaanensis]|uniref:Transporter n=1 Tax=Glacieibacterium arshaanense TaxID=2511025 RepID=A0A4Y9ERA7_9SPHN|nr:hypothetical protein [Polymorphobacter arshaanensis]TFU06134.1 hypothetical protein EUV02_03730 [Polymorphobacter arshaanensis]